jgi:hypothetical protein
MSPNPHDVPAPKGKTSSQKFAEADAKYASQLEKMSHTERVNTDHFRSGGSVTSGSLADADDPFTTTP